MNHYTTNKLHTFEALKEVFIEADDLNWLFLSTSGVHGSYIDANDLRKYFKDPETWVAEENAGEAYDPSITVLVLQPRKVTSYYGNITVTAEELEWLVVEAGETADIIKGVVAPWVDPPT